MSAHQALECRFVSALDETGEQLPVGKVIPMAQNGCAAKAPDNGAHQTSGHFTRLEQQRYLSLLKLLEADGPARRIIFR
jgi:hypothetical protein